ncbi:phosphodiesterase [uncultured Roseobacter sp.]|uniref:phosphodiesterase n=1 Tax=uncultured Roseobacter sp. TaxID=114847 RepID=UPI00261875EA|nr:phosphodiesterase [uncultured Roseobacter sp.]
MTKIIQISDPHIVPHGQLAYDRVDTAPPLAECVETINRMLPRIGLVDMAIVTGDLTDFGSAEEYQRFRDLMAPLEVPYRVIPGNHDNIDVMRTSFGDQTWMPRSGPINWVQEFSNLALIGLDSSVAGQSHGHLSTQTLAFLKESLDGMALKTVLVAMHHPPFLTGKHKMDTQNLRDSSDLGEILSAYRGELRLICGHVHRNIVSLFGNVVCQIAPGTSHAVTMDLRPDAPNCLTREPGAFLLHETRNGLISHNIPIGQFDGPWLFYPDRG